MKKILLLGGSAQQVIAIETAKKLGYFTVLCDFLDDNPGQYVADKFYLVSTTDKEAVLTVAKEEKIDGILAYASDPAAPTAAYVAEKLGLPGNPYESVDILCNKDKFRKFLAENGFATPKAKGYSSIEEALEDINKNYFDFPVIVKPVDSSGSKGVSVIHGKEENVKKLLTYAFSFSRSKKIIIESFIVKDHPFLIGGDIFVVDGKVELWGLLNCHRDAMVNPLVPVGKSYPLLLTETQVQIAKQTLQSLVSKLNIKSGSMNVELVITKDQKCYLLDIGPRAGGNMIPDLLGMIFDVDVVKMAVQVAMGESVQVEFPCRDVYYATHNLHSSKKGLFSRIEFDGRLEQHIVKKCIYKKENDSVEYFDYATKAIGIIFMKFDSLKQMRSFLFDINRYINIVLKGSE